MKANKILTVYYEEKLVGALAMAKDTKVAFEYDDNWLAHGFSISPFSLPLTKKAFLPGKSHFNGLFGMFGDSLPDAWGNLLLDRVLKKSGVNPGEISMLDRLAIVGSSGMGALEYRPENEIVYPDISADLDTLAQESKKVLEMKNTDELDALYMAGGTSGGTRPKVMIEADGTDWIIKFPAHNEDPASGQREYEYSLCAKKCGIDMPQTKLFPSRICPGYFGTERFDRVKTPDGKKKIHMVSAAALLELDFRQPSMDYHDLMKLTKILTKDHPRHVQNMLRRACFNVFAHNRDDHSKNFSFLYDIKTSRWILSPAYDLTYSNTYFGQHTTSVDGNGTNPGEKELLQVGLTAGISKNLCLDIISEVKKVVEDARLV